MVTKTCSKCGREFPATTEYFYKNYNGKLGLSNTCKNCDNLRLKLARQIKNKYKYETEFKIKTELQLKGTKICSKCGKELPANSYYFYRNAKSNDGLRCECKQCQQIQYAKYYASKHRQEKETKTKIEQDLKQRGKRICSKCGK